MSPFYVKFSGERGFKLVVVLAAFFEKKNIVIWSKNIALGRNFPPLCSAPSTFTTHEQEEEKFIGKVLFLNCEKVKLGGISGSP